MSGKLIQPPELVPGIDPARLSPERQARYWIFAYGHHRPFMPPDISWEHFCECPEHRIEQAVKSYQEWFGDSLDQLCNEHHNRAASKDGLIGPATIELVTNRERFPRCGMPDFPAIAAQANWPDS